MKARIPKHREFIIDFPQDMDQAKADEGWNKLLQKTSCFFFCFFFTLLLDTDRRIHNIFQHRIVWKQIKILKYQSVTSFIMDRSAVCLL